MKKLIAISLAVAMVLSLSSVAFADAGFSIEGSTVIGGSSESYAGNFGSYAETAPTTDTIPSFGGSMGYDSGVTTTPTGPVPTPEPPVSITHTIIFNVRSGDKINNIDRAQATIHGRHTVGGECVPVIEVPSGWAFDGFYINNVRYSASELAAYEIPVGVDILNVEIRSYPDRNGDHSDDRGETYTVYFEIRHGDKGELEFDTATVVGEGNTLESSDIPTLDDHSYKYSISGYYVDGKKYTKSQLSRLPIDRDTTVVVATYWNKSGAPSDYEEFLEAHGYIDCNGNWVGLRPICPINNGCYIGNIWYDAPVLGPNGWYYYGNQPCYQYNGYWYPVETATVKFKPQNGESSHSVNVYTGYPVNPPARPYCKGYTFLGWSTTSDGRTGYWNFANPVAGNLTLYGIWTKNSNAPSYPSVQPYPNPSWVNEGQQPSWNGNKLVCKVNLIPGNGMTFKPTEIEYGSYIKVQGAPTCPGYSFVGWATDPQGRHFWNFDKDKVMTDITLYGIWQPYGAAPIVNPQTGAAC